MPTAVAELEEVSNAGRHLTGNTGGKKGAERQDEDGYGWPSNVDVHVLNLADTDPDLKGFHGGFASRGYGYFVPHFNNAYFGKVARVDLATFSQVQELDLTATDPDLKGFHGGFASR